MIYLYDSTETDFRYNGKPLPTAYDVDVQYTLNGEYYVNGKQPLDKGNVYKEIVEDRIVKVHTMDGMQPFRIVNVNKRELYVEFEAWPLFYADMRNKLVRPLNLRRVNGQTALNAFVNSLLIDTPFTFYSNITDTRDYHTQDETERENNPKQLYNALDVFKDIVNRWQGELWIRGYDIRVNDRIGTDTEAMLYEKKNISEFVDTTNIEGIVTRLHGKSEWQDERQEGEEEGQKHLIETTVDSPLINNYSGVIFEKQYTNNDIRTAQEMRNWLNLKFTTENIDKPTRTIEVGTNIIDGTLIKAADTLILKYMIHDTDVRIKVVGYTYDGFANEVKQIILGEPKTTSVSTIGNTITDLVNNIVEPVSRKSTIAMASADGKATVFHGTADPNTLNLNAKENDIYFRKNGSEKQIYRFTGTLWDKEIDTSDTTKNTRAIEAVIAQAESDKEALEGEIDQALSDAKQHADAEVAASKAAFDETFNLVDAEIESISEVANTTAADVAQAVSNAGFTSLTDTISSVQTNAADAWNNAQTAISDAGNAVSLANDLSGQVSDFEVTVDGFNQVVNDYEGQVAGFRSDVSGLNSTVVGYQEDVQGYESQVSILNNTVSGFNASVQRVEANYGTLSETVSSIGADVGIVAGQINSRVWNTDIASAIGDIEVGGRNLLSYRYENYTLATYAYKELVPENTPLILKLYEKDDSIDMGNIYFGFTRDGAGSAGGVKWAMAGGSLTSNLNDDLEMTVSDMRFFSFYPRTEEVFNRILERYDLKLEKGTIATDWTPAPEDTEAKISHIETEWTQTFENFSQTVTDIDGRVSNQKQTIDSITATVYDEHSERISTVEQIAGGLQSTVQGKVDIVDYESAFGSLEDWVLNEFDTWNTYIGTVQTQWTQTFDSFSQKVTADFSDIDDTIATMESQITQNLENINLRVEKGDVLSQINIEAERTLIQSDRLYLDASSVLFSGTAFIPNAVIESIHADKITAGTIKTARLDTRDIVTQGLTANVVKATHIQADTALFDMLFTSSLATTRLAAQTAWIQNINIADASIDGAKIQDATIGSAKIASLDVDKLSGNISTFMRTSWNSIDSTVQMTGDGFDLYIEGAHHGGLRATHSEEESSRMGRYGKRSMSLYAGDNAFVSLSYQGGRTDGGEYNALSVLGYSGEIEIFAPTTYLHGTLSMTSQLLHFQGGHTISTHSTANNLEIRSGSTSTPITFHSGGRLLATLGSEITTNTTMNLGGTLRANGNHIYANRVYVGGSSVNYIDTSNGIRLVNTQGQVSLWSNNSISVAIGTGMMMHVPLNMNNNPIWNESDRILKTAIKDTKLNVLEDFFDVIQPVDYYWKDPDKGTGEQFGLIAQDTPIISDTFEGTWMIDSSKQTMINTFGIKELYHREQNTNTIASQALQLGETNAQKIKRLEKRIEELESAA